MVRRNEASATDRALVDQLEQIRAEGGGVFKTWTFGIPEMLQMVLPCAAGERLPLEAEAMLIAAERMRKKVATGGRLLCANCDHQFTVERGPAAYLVVTGHTAKPVGAV